MVHLLNGYLVKFLQAVGLRHALVDKHLPDSITITTIITTAVTAALAVEALAAAEVFAVAEAASAEAAAAAVAAEDTEKSAREKLRVKEGIRYGGFLSLFNT